MIRVSELTKDYGPRRAIDRITFDARRGEILGFLGPNGAGKTTTMRILTGYMPPTSGHAEVGGYDVVEESLAVRKLVGYLPETVPLYPDMTVFEYLKYFGDLRNLKNVEERIDYVLEIVHMEDRAEGFIGKLSKGMRQRIGLAQALLHEPDVLILDEPTIGLDPAQIIEVRNLIREIGAQKTVLLSTHILSEAQQVCNRVLIINKGRIVAEDTPEQLQTRLAGGTRVQVNFRGEAKEVVPLVEKIPGVVRVVDLQNGNLELETSSGMDARPEVARIIVNKGFDLIELHAASLSLEDIFLELTREDPVSPSLGDRAPSEIAEEPAQ